MKKTTYPRINRVSPPEHIKIVKDIFSTVTDRYDLLNHLLSLRRDIAWRNRMVARMRFFRNRNFLDVATGTADVALRAARVHSSIRVTGIDFSEEMLRLGRRKMKREHADPSRIDFLLGDGTELPFADDTFDVVGIAFGIRNIPDKTGALREMRRVAVPGGQVMVLEMLKPPGGSFSALYGIYLNSVLPLMGRLISGNPAAYEYLGDSILNFPAPDEFTSMMNRAGLNWVEVDPLTFGIACLFIGRKPG